MHVQSPCGEKEHGMNWWLKEHRCGPACRKWGWCPGLGLKRDAESCRSAVVTTDSMRLASNRVGDTTRWPILWKVVSDFLHWMDQCIQPLSRVRHTISAQFLLHGSWLCQLQPGWVTHNSKCHLQNADDNSFLVSFGRTDWIYQVRRYLDPCLAQ